MKIQAAPRDAHPEGTYHFTIRAVREAGQRSYTPRDATEPVTVTSIRVGMQSESGTYVWDSFDVDGDWAWRLTAMAEKALGRRFKKGESFDTDQLIDKPVGATVVHEEGAQGTFTKLRDFFAIPAVGAAMPKAAKTATIAPLPKPRPTLKTFPGGKKTAPKK